MPPTKRQIPDWIRRVGQVSWYFIGFCGAVSLLVLIFAASRDITIPLLLGTVLAVAFAPLADWLSSKGIPRSLAAVMVVVLIIVIAVGVVVVVAAGLSNQSDELTVRITEATDDLKAWANDLDIDPGIVDKVRSSVDNSTQTVSSGLANNLVGFVNSAAGFVTGTILGLMILYYLLKDGSKLVDNFITDQGEEVQPRLQRVADDSAKSIRAFAKGRTILAAMNGVVIGLAAAILGIPLVFPIALVNFIGAYIPYFGAFIGGAFAFLLALSVGGIGLGLENLLEPRLLGDQLALHPLVVLLVTAMGGLAAGIVGLILAAPLTAIGMNVFREVKASGFFD